MDNELIEKYKKELMRMHRIKPTAAEPEGNGDGDFKPLPRGKGKGYGFYGGLYDAQYNRHRFYR